MPPQKKEINRAASLKINQIKQCCTVLYKAVKSIIPYMLSVKTSINKKNSILQNINNNNTTLIISKVQVLTDINTKVIKLKTK